MFSPIQVAILVIATCQCIMSAPALRSATGPKIIDRVEVDIRTVAGSLCSDEANFQISKVSTIVELHYFFHINDKFACDSYYKAIVKDLYDLNTANQVNVCSPDVAEQMRKFHHKYISTTDEDKASRAKSTPEVLSFFFKNYVMQSSEVCKVNLQKNLRAKSIPNVGPSEFDLDSDGDVSKLVKSLSDLFGDVAKVNNYEHYISVWDVLQDILTTNSVDRIGEFINAGDAESKAFVKMSNPQVLVNLQDKCRMQLKPVYDHIFLSVFNMANLGYSANTDATVEAMSTIQKNAAAKKWFAITQVCELILPIKVNLDATLEPFEMKLVTKFEANRLTGANGELKSSSNTKPVQYVAMNNFDDDQLKFAKSKDWKKLVDSLDSSFDVRNSAGFQLMKKVVVEALTKNI